MIPHERESVSGFCVWLFLALDIFELQRYEKSLKQQNIYS